MANLTKTPTPRDLERTKFAEKVAYELAQGLTGPEVAHKLAKGNKKLAKKYRQKIRHMAYRDQEHLKEAVARQATGDTILGLNGTVAAVVKRAQRGRMDAAKVILEATGFHNPRVKHEHSGEVKITMNMARPTFNGDREEGIVDATVVEDE